MAVQLGCFIADRVIPSLMRGCEGAYNRVLSRRKHSGSNEEDLALPHLAGVRMPLASYAGTLFEEDKLWAVLRPLPGVMLWVAVGLCFILPGTAPWAVALITFGCMGQCIVTMLFSLAYTYVGFRRMERSMMNPVTIPPLPSRPARAGRAGTYEEAAAAGSSQGSGSGSSSGSALGGSSEGGSEEGGGSGAPLGSADAGSMEGSAAEEGSSSSSSSSSGAGAGGGEGGAGGSSSTALQRGSISSVGSTGSSGNSSSSSSSSSSSASSATTANPISGTSGSPGASSANPSSSSSASTTSNSSSSSSSSSNSTKARGGGAASLSALPHPHQEIQLHAAEVVHLVAICRCTEPIDVLEEVLDGMALHSNRGQYVILICLEARDPAAESVGESLVLRYSAAFKRLIYAVHPGGVEAEVPGKSSNVNFGVRAAHAALEAEWGARAMDALVVTCADCDAKISEHYFNELSVRYAASIRERRETFFAPPTLFDLESAEAAAAAAAAEAEEEARASGSSVSVDLLATLLGASGACIVRSLLGHVIPGPVKIADQMWSILVLQQLSSSNWVRLPCSTYSVGLKLMASVGYWDTGVESVPEDYHTGLKLFWCTGGRARCEPIFHPVLYQHIDGGTWFGTASQRFQQGVRHMWGATDLAFILWCVFRIPGVPFLAQLRIVSTVFDAHISVCASAFLSTFAMPLLAFLRPGYYATPLGSLLLTVHINSIYALLAITFVTGAVYEWYAGEMVRVCKRGPAASLEEPAIYPFTLPGGGKASSASLTSSFSSTSLFTSPTSAAAAAAAGGSGGEGAAAAAGAAAGSAASATAAAAAPAAAGTAASSSAASGANPSLPSSSSASPAGHSSSSSSSSNLAATAAAGSSSSGGGAPPSPPAHLTLTLSHVHSLKDSHPPPPHYGASASQALGSLPSINRSVLGRLRSGAWTWAGAKDYCLKMLPWVWAPLTAVVYMLAPAAMAQTKLMFQNRMRKAHVSPKSSPTPVQTPRPGAATPVGLGGPLTDSPTQMQHVISALEAFAPSARMVKMQLPAALTFGRRLD